MASNAINDPQQEIRKLNYSHKKKIGEFLDDNDLWKKLMDAIPLSLYPTKSKDKRFTYHDICTVETAIRNSTKSATELLIDEWGTMGQHRPTVQDLFDLCLEIEAIRAASYISEKILNRGPIGHNSTITFEDEDDYDDILESDLSTVVNGESAFDNSDVFASPVIPEHTLKTHRVKFSYLEIISDGFSDNRLLGRGGFSRVYLGITRRQNLQLAIKLLNANEADPGALDRQLNYEVDQLPRLKHPNIIELLGYSNDVAGKACLLYPFMPKGTLETKLRDKADPLTDEQRWIIARGVASGLDHLHSQPKKLVHRDVKTSNILLSHNCSPKLADFGLLRFGVGGDGATVTFTSAVRGTPAYMPPEAITGDVSVKWDVWSYGVVILELMTGLQVVDRSREDQDLVSHIENIAEEDGFDIQQVLDSSIVWNSLRAQILFEISTSCRLRNKTKRPDMKEVLRKMDESSL